MKTYNPLNCESHFDFYLNLKKYSFEQLNGQRGIQGIMMSQS